MSKSKIFIYLVCMGISLPSYSIEIISPFGFIGEMRRVFYSRGRCKRGDFGHRNKTLCWRSSLYGLTTEEKIAEVDERFVKVSTPDKVLYYRYPVLYDPQHGFSKVTIKDHRSGITYMTIY